MNNYSIKLDLKKLKRVSVLNLKGKSGNAVKCLVIPVDDNPELYIGEKGAYLNLTALELKEKGQYGDTHLVKGNLPVETYRAMSEDERKALPILGNMQPFERREVPADGTVEVEDDLPW